MKVPGEMKLPPNFKTSNNVEGGLENRDVPMQTATGPEEPEIR
jgi:hypothetical protein